jgi:pimeloyl-ACP methyl ester carboxylesterase
VSSPLAVSAADLDDLLDRLRRTRWAADLPGASWEAGTDRAELRRLVDYWADGFDWRAQEAAINALPHRFARLDGDTVHYLRFDGESAGALPIVLTHGWPSSFLELTELARRLAGPSQYGGDAADAFTVIVPSLPGYGLSPQPTTLPGARPAEELWHRLMRDELGFERYAAHGGDLGAGVTARLAQAHPEAVVGIHVLAVAGPRKAVSPTPEEQAFLDAVEAWNSAEGAYMHQQQTRPMTVAYGLADSPAGLLGWLVEKYRAWSAHQPSDDFVLTQASLYWFTNTISSSFRPYYEYARGLVTPVERVTVPTAVAVFPSDNDHPPRSWAERSYHVTRYTRMPRGGHFAAHEEPELLAEDLTAFFRTLR